MFHILRRDDKKITLLGLVEKVTYIKVSKKTGCFISAEKDEAEGVAYKGVAYNLDGKEEIKDAASVIVSETDGGETLYRVEADERSLAKQLAETDEAAIELYEASIALAEENAELANQIAETDEAAIELYEANIALEEANAEQDEAIIEIYEMIGDITNG